MSAVGLVLRTGVRKRRVQTIVIGLVTLMAVTASILGAGLLAVSSAPFDAAFAAQHGAHLSATFDPARVAPGRLAAAHPPGVTATAGPFPTVTITPQIDGRMDFPLNVVGRDTPNAAVDQLTLVKGTWAHAPGEVVLSDGRWFNPLGMTLVLPELPGSPTLTVVGTARSAGQSADGWTSSTQAAALASGRPDGYQMLYRLTTPDTTAAIDAARTAVSAGLPANALAGTQSWLDVKQAAERDTAVYVPFLLAFGILGLIMSVLIVGNVVAAAVSAGTRRIGVLKAVGFTPAQVVRTYLGQALIPALAGAVVGVVAGHLLAVPILAETSDAYGTAPRGVPPWIDAVVTAGILALVTATAWAAAWRAGRLRTIDALAVGRTSRAGRGHAITRLIERLPLSRPITLGLARPFARPVRALAMITAVAFGATAVTFAIGLATSLDEILTARRHNTADVTVSAATPATGPGGAGPDGPPPDLPTDTSAITTAIRAQPGTKAYYSIATTPATVAGTSGVTILNAFTGDATWGGYTMIDGDWFDAPGEAVAPTGFLSTTGRVIGDTVTLNVADRHVTLRIVGEVFDTTNDGMSVFTDVTNLSTAVPVAGIKISLTPGTDTTAYAEALEQALQPMGATTTAPTVGGSDMMVVLNSLTAILTLMLVTVAGLGVLNTVLLDTRERVRDIGIHKAIGMTPSQTITSVLSSVAVNGLIGGVIGVTAGVIVHRTVVPAMGSAAGLRLPQVAYDVYPAPTLALLGLGGLVIALAGALPPATWAARTRTTTALRAE